MEGMRGWAKIWGKNQDLIDLRIDHDYDYMSLENPPYKLKLMSSND